MKFYGDATQQFFRGADASRVLAIAPSRSQTFLGWGLSNPKQLSAGAPKAAREALALPRP